MALTKAAEEEQVKVRRSIQERFKPSVELEVIEGLKVGVYSRPKIGKTHFSLTAPLPIYIIDTENAVPLNIKRFPKDRQEQVFVCNVIQFAEKAEFGKRKVNLMKSLDELMESVDVLTDMIEDSEKTDPDKPRGTIVIDSASDVWEWLSIWVDLNAARTKAGNVNRLEWGTVNGRYADFMYMLLTSKWNAVLTFRAEPVVNTKGQDEGYDKAKWQKKTGHWLDLITELQLDGPEVVMRFRGDRFGRLNKDLHDPTWDKLVVYLEKESGVKVKR